MSSVIPFVRPAATRSASWSQQELAEFYRVEAALMRAGIGIASEHGVSDEGEPWFVFCRPDGDAIMHFARIDGSYLIASEVLDHPVRGADFRAMIDQIALLHPHLLPIPVTATGTKLVVHPAALLAALVAAAALSLSSEDAHAGDLPPGPESASPSEPAEGGGTAPDQPSPARAKGTGPSEQGSGRKQFEAIVLSTMIFAAEALAGDHGDGNAEFSHPLSDLASSAANHLAPGDAALGASGGFDAGLGSGASTQPSVLSAQGSGASQDTASPGSRIEAAPTIRPDLSGDRAGPTGRESEHHAPSSGNEAVPVRVSTEAGGLGSNGPQTSATGRSDGATGVPEASGTDGSDQRGTSSQSSVLDPGTQSRLAEALQSDTGKGTASQAWIHAAGQADLGRAAASVSHDADDGDSGRGHGSGSDAAVTDSAQAVRSEEGRGRGSAHDAQSESGSDSQGSVGARVPGDDGDHGSSHQNAVSKPEDSAQAEGGGKAGHGSGPAAQSEHQGQGPGESGSHSGEANPGRGISGGDGSASASVKGDGGDHGSSHQNAVSKPVGSAQAEGGGTAGHGSGPAAQSEHQGQGPGESGSHPGEANPGRGNPGEDGGHQSSSAPEAASHASTPPTAAGQGAEKAAADQKPGQEHGSASEHGPGAHSDQAVAHAASASSNPSHEGSDAAKGDGAGPENTGSPASAASHAAPKGTPDHANGAATSHGQTSDASDHGASAHKGSEPPAAQDHPNSGTPALSAAQDQAGGHQPSHADPTQPEHGTTSPSGGQDASVHKGADGSAPSPSDSASQVDTSPTSADHQQKAAADPAATVVDHGSNASAADKAPSVEGQHSPADGTGNSQAATHSPDTQADPAGVGKTHPSDPADPTAVQPAPQRATIDPNGNLVFHADNHQDAPSPTASHGPSDASPHPDVGLVGISDHGHVVHDLYHHS